jgi:hypothetical protein
MRLGEAAPERLLDHHAAAVGKPDRGERQDGGRERGRREGEVGDDGTLGLVDRAGERGRLADIGPMVAGQRRDGLSGGRVDGGRVAFEPRGDMAAEGGGVPVVAGHADNHERLR